MTGDEIKGAIEGLRGMIQQLEDLFVQADQASGRNIDSLRSIGNSLRGVKEELVGLNETSRDLKMLALSTKIQSTRTGKGISAFMQLGQDIGKMSEVISSKSSDLLGDTASLAELVTDVFSNLRGLKQRQEYQTDNVLKGTHGIVESLANLSAKSGDEVDQITRNSESITGNIGELVESVQYQDITKQALDRIINDLNRAGQRGVQKASEPEDAQEKLELSDDLILIGVCMKQTSCLKDTGEQISHAVRKMIENHKSVAKSIEDMTSVTGKASSESSYFLKELEEGMGSVTSYLSEVVESGKEMSDAMNSLANTVEGMSVFTGDIEMISSEVELISLNARIMAAQTGSGGAGMGVIAQAVQATANDSENQRKSLVKLLGEVSERSVDLKTEILKVAKGEEVQLDQLVRELGVFLDALRIMQRRIVQTLDKIDAMSRELHEKISLSSHKIRIHQSIGKRVEEIIMAMEKACEHWCGMIPAEELFQITDGRFPIPELHRLAASQKLRIIREHFPDELFDRCFNEEGETTSEDEGILF
jgi:methyl-accepting chemotaxis protein